MHLKKSKSNHIIHNKQTEKQTNIVKEKCLTC